MLKSLVFGVVVLVALVVGYFAVVLNWSYSSGERAGWVQKFSHKGWVCKTWEGELALVSLPGSTVEKFYFTVRNEAVAQQLERVMGKRVSVHYEEKVGLPTSCFGETRYYVTRVAETPDIPLGPGVSLQNTSSSSVGATATGAGNVIANNTGAGVTVGPTSGSGNAILGNAIYANSTFCKTGTTYVQYNNVRIAGNPTGTFTASHSALSTIWGGCSGAVFRSSDVGWGSQTL